MCYNVGIHANVIFQLLNTIVTNMYTYEAHINTMYSVKCKGLKQSYNCLLKVLCFTGNKKKKKRNRFIT